MTHFKCQQCENHPNQIENYVAPTGKARHQMETFSTSLAICAVTGEFSAQRPVTLSFDAFFDPRLNKRLNIQSWNWWFDLVIRHISFVYYSCSLSNWNKLFQNDIHTKRWCGHAGMLDDVILLFFPSLVSNVYFNCIFQYSLYHNRYIDTMSWRDQIR